MCPSNECTFCGNDCGQDQHPCGCGSSFCSIDCLMVHGEHQHSVNDHSIVWPVGTDQRLFTAIDAEYESNEEPTDDELSSDDESSSHDEHSQEDLSDNNVYCECGNTVGYLVGGEFRTDADCYRSECDQDGTRWCSDCWGLDRQYQEECDENEPDEEENETEPIIRCECCYKPLDQDGFTNNKGSFCSNVCLQLWTGCPYICPEIVAETSHHHSVARRLNFDQVAENAAQDFQHLPAPLLV